VGSKFYKVIALILIVVFTLNIAVTAFAETPDVTLTSQNKDGLVDKINQGIKDVFRGEPGNLLERTLAYLIGGIAAALMGLVQWLTGMDSMFGVIYTDKVNDIDPFTPQQLQVMNYWYQALIFIGVIILFIALLFVVFEMIFAGYSPKHKDEVKERIERIFFVGIIIAVTPIAFRLLLYINNALTHYLYSLLKLPGNVNDLFSPTVVFANIHTGNVLFTAIGMLLLAYINFYIVMIFTVRKFVMMIFYIFTPIAATLWSLKKDITAARIWLGELLTNIFTQFFYALVFTIYFSATGTMNVGGNTVHISKSIEALLWLYVLIPTAEALRNSLQGYFTRLAGINEGGIAHHLALMFGASSAVTAVSTFAAQVGTASAAGGIAGQVMGALGGRIQNPLSGGSGSLTGFSNSSGFSTGFSGSGAVAGTIPAGSLTREGFSGSVPAGGTSGTVPSGSLTGRGFSGFASIGPALGGIDKSLPDGTRVLPSGERVLPSGVVVPPGVELPENTGFFGGENAGAAVQPGYNLNRLNMSRSSSEKPTGGILDNKGISSETTEKQNSADSYNDPRYMFARMADRTTKLAHYGTMVGGLVDRSMGVSRGFGSLAAKGGASAVGTAAGLLDAYRHAKSTGQTLGESLRQITGVTDSGTKGTLKAVKRLAHANISASFSGPHRVAQHMARFHNTSLDGYRWKA